MSPRTERAALGVLVTLGFVLRLAFVNRADLWSDEAVSWAVAAGDLSGLGTRVATLEAKPPLYFAILHVWMALFGDSEAAMRSLSAMFWPPLALLTAAIGKHCGMRWRFLAVGLAAVSPLLVYHGAEARPYAMLVCAEAWFGLLVLRMLDSDAPALRAWLAVSSFCIVSIQFTGLLFILPILGFYVVRRRRDRRELFLTLAPQAAAALLFALMLVVMSPGVFSHLGRLQTHWWAPAPSIVQVLSAPVRLVAPVSSWHFYTDWSRPLNILLFVSAAGLTALGGVGLATSPRKGSLIAAVAGVIALFTVYSVTRANLLFPRYYIGCAPFLLLGVAAAAERVGEKSRRWGGVVLTAVVLGSIVLLVALRPFARTPAYRDAVETILARDAGPVTILTGGWDGPAVRYYTRKAAGRVVLSDSPSSTQASSFYLLESFSWKDRTGMMDAVKADASVTFDGGGVTVYRIRK